MATERVLMRPCGEGERGAEGEGRGGRLRMRMRMRGASDGTDRIAAAVRGMWRDTKVEARADSRGMARQTGPRPDSDPARRSPDPRRT
ncbi:hypothetical protein WS84_10685 [Burkholderia anthina]|nr:hypothetical protein WS85_04390 [Burkholderia anthina]OXI23271.1 hypothetical protein CFB35_15340 [Burkholderia sp. AU16482]KVH12530.1 hypothetical protein WS84_10685 [Burkholderia anthina]KVM94829.1 hypothetical protein WT06_10225 [Burkholderia anthina]KVN59926.1 hypothetical protein WT13_18705 [Burkholderia anthina]